jgi:hypothetical protein
MLAHSYCLIIVPRNPDFYLGKREYQLIGGATKGERRRAEGGRRKGRAVAQIGEKCGRKRNDRKKLRQHENGVELPRALSAVD